MNVNKVNVYKEGSCSFCKRGKLNSNGIGLRYPYHDVYEIEGAGMKARLCEDCAQKLIQAVTVGKDNNTK